VRCFVALLPPLELRRSLAERVGPALAGHADLSPTRLEAMHLTLLFLGEIEAQYGPELGEALARHCEPIPAFDLQITGAGAFPSPSSARVIWAGLSEGEGRELETLRRAVLESAADIGWSPPPRDAERPFHPHLTLARARRGGRPRAMPEALLAEVDSLPWRVNAVELLSSHLELGGARYECLRRVALRNP
jgi:2'-5' RNA ligase